MLRAGSTRNRNKQQPEHGKVELDLLALALRAQQAKEERKKPRAPPTTAASSPTTLVKIGKVRGAGELARRKNRLSTLKKSIVRERRARFLLAHPDAMPIPLQVHPSLHGLDCMWLLGATQGGGGGAVAGDGEAEEDSSSSSDEDFDEEALFEQEEEEEDFVSPAALGFQVEFDAAVASPVFFGCFFKQTSAISPPSAPLLLLPTQPLCASYGGVREYVTQALSPKLDSTIALTLERLFKFQERARLEDVARTGGGGDLETSRRRWRRMVIGLREVRKAVKTKRCICVVLAPNIETNLLALDDKVRDILALCRDNPTRQEFEAPIPIVFTGMSKLRVGKCLGLSGGGRPVSAIALLSADGAHDEFKLMLVGARDMAAFWQSRVDAEAELAKTRGARPHCSRCLRELVKEEDKEAVLFACIGCLAWYCQPCSQSVVARHVACSVVKAKVEDDATSSCNVVRVARSIKPELGHKPALSTKAAEFVPHVPPPLPTSAEKKKELSRFAQPFVPKMQ